VAEPNRSAFVFSSDRVRAGSIAGWAQNTDAPEAPVGLDIFADGKLIGQVLANSYREDLKRAGLGTGRHAFTSRRRRAASLSPVVEGEKLPITVSIGIAGATVTTAGIQLLLNSADQALYEAKRSGRNRVVQWRPPVEMAAREGAE
jgi:hypothetical protein